MNIPLMLPLDLQRQLQRTPMPASVTLAEINRLNQQFWSKESQSLRKRLEDPCILEFVNAQLRSDAARRVPVRFRKTMETLAAEAEQLIRVATSAQARRGGQAAKADALQRLIEALVQKTPNLNGVQLLDALRREVGGNVVDEIDEHAGEIVFQARSGHLGERLKSAKISGLKDRLYRARRKARIARAG